MASSSSSSSSSSFQEKYDVFLSFRGEDTRYGFIGHLYDALCQKNHILTFKDDENLESGHRISEIMQAIRESKICIIVFSKDFASSTWCLDEVVRILECKRNGNDVIPIFYGIEPSIVRKQEESYAVSFAKHEQRFKDNMDKVKQWRDALKEVTDISGYDSKNFRPDYMLIQKIVEDVLLKLPKYQLTNDHFERHLIGIEEPMKEIESLLCIGSMDVRIIGIWGMGGIGKTTLASIVFQRFSCSHFEGYCFLKDVREESERHGTDHLRKKLLSVLLKDEAIINMDTPFVVSAFIQDRFRHKKVLVVLDDVDAISTLQNLLEGFDQFAGGSRIIVTSRDVQVLRIVADKTYEVKRLNDFEALKLFRLHAFKQNSDLAADYETLSEEVANYAEGNPLALKVLGSSLYSKSKKEWESALGKLQIGPDKDIQKVLKVSYDGLGDKVIQDIFLDIAIFFNGEVDREYAESILHRTDHSDATIGISVLIDKSLVIEYKKRLSMHALLRQMGKAIVCDENKEPGNRSRLWKAKDVCHVLERNTGSSEIEGILLNQIEIKKDVKVRSTAFSKMYHLRFLRMHCDGKFGYIKGLCKIKNLPFEGIEYLSDELRYFQWDSYPLKYFPPNFSPENLVELIMRESQLVELLWNENQAVEKLKKIDLSYSEHLIQLPNLHGAINLETMTLRGCKSLVEVPLYFKNLDKLQFLDLNDCENLEDFIENLPLNIRELSLSGTAIEVVPSSIGCLLGLSSLNLSYCKRLKSLPENIWKLKYLKSLDICGCSNLEKLPEISDCTSSSLQQLNINECKRLKSITELPSSLTYLDAENCESLETISSWRTPTAQDLGKNSFIYRFDNCLKLNQHTRNNIIADRLRRRIYESLMYEQDDSFSDFDIEAMYPGDEIPEWFSYQTDEIYFQLPSNWFPFLVENSNWFPINDGRFQFVFCAVIVLNMSKELVDIQFEFNFKTNINSDDGRYNYNGQIPLIFSSGTVNPAHVLTIYKTIYLKDVLGAKWSSICSNINEASFRVSFKGERGVDWEIKKCGLELVNTWCGGASKRRFDECCGQPDGYQDKDDDDDDYSHHPHINSKRINLMPISIE